MLQLLWLAEIPSSLQAYAGRCSLFSKLELGILRDAPQFNFDLEILNRLQNTKPSTLSKAIEHIENSKQLTASTKIQILT